jgi:hypothetical protein
VVGQFFQDFYCLANRQLEIGRQNPFAVASLPAVNGISAALAFAAYIGVFSVSCPKRTAKQKNWKIK